MANALVVGASSGIGRAIAIKLSQTHKVFAMARREDKLEELRDRDITPVVFDVTNLDEIEKTLKTLAKEYGKFSTLIYSAGVQNIKPIRVIKPTEVEYLYRVNTIAPLFFAKAFASKSVLDKENYPSIIFISSIASQKPEKGIVAYGASKASLDNMTKALAKELAPIRVNGIAPGFLETEMTKSYEHIYTDEFIEQIKQNYPLGLGSVDDIAEVSSFLVSKSAKYITGEIIRVDGGGAL